MRRNIFLLIAMMMLSLSASAEGNGVLGFVSKLGTLLDSMALNGVDRRYIGAPEKPWQVMLRSEVSQSDLKLNSTIRHAEELFPFMQGDIVWEPRIKTHPASYLGVWAGYRGYGLSYSWNIGGDKGRILTFGATGGSYGVNLRIHWFENDNPEVHFAGNALNDITTDGTFVYAPFTYDDKVDLGSPVKTRTLFLDAYYLFNGTKCSYAAAYDQSVIQKRSAGSLIAGAMYFHSTTSYDTDANADLMLFMNDIGRFKSWQTSAGVGYIYNWVPAHGLLISAMAIPMVTFHNHIKLWRYDSNLKDLVLTEGMDDAGDLDATGYTIRPSAQNPVESKNSNITLNFDARLSLSYELNDRLLFNAYGQFCNFRYKTNDFSGRLNDWYIKATIGIRL